MTVSRKGARLWTALGVTRLDKRPKTPRRRPTMPRRAEPGDRKADRRIGLDAAEPSADRRADGEFRARFALGPGRGVAFREFLRDPVQPLAALKFAPDLVRLDAHGRPEMPVSTASSATFFAILAMPPAKSLAVRERLGSPPRVRPMAA